MHANPSTPTPNPFTLFRACRSSIIILYSHLQVPAARVFTGKFLLLQPPLFPGLHGAIRIRAGFLIACIVIVMVNDVYWYSFSNPYRGLSSLQGSTACSSSSLIHSSLSLSLSSSSSSSSLIHSGLTCACGGLGDKREGIRGQG